jgi:hypothetical protein
MEFEELGIAFEILDPVYLEDESRFYIASSCIYLAQNL